MSNNKGRLKVVITDCMHLPVTYEEKILEEYGIEAELYNCLTEEQVIEAAKDADGIIVHFAPITRKVIESLDKLKIICRYGVGVDNVDIAAATERKIVFCNVPDYCTNEVAEHALALLLAAARKIVYADYLTRNYDWEITNLEPVDTFEGKILGLVGFGKIGSSFARRAVALGCKILVYDPYVSKKKVEAEGYEYTNNLDDIWTKSDFISLHIPLKEDTKYIVGRDELKKMKKTAIIVNTSRGKLIDETALLEALKEGEIQGAALDVFENEPPPKEHPMFKEKKIVKNPLYELSPAKITVTPHMGWYSIHSYRKLKETPALIVARFLKGERPKNVLNPEVLES